MTYQEFEKKFCDAERMSPAEFRNALWNHVELFKPSGWFMLECRVLDSSELVVLPFGGESTWADVPADDKLISPRGLAASDLSRVVGSILLEDLPKEES